MKITAQSNIIQAILDALEQSIYGIGIAFKCDVEYNMDNYESYVELIPKDGHHLLQDDVFWLGFVSREYMEIS